MEIFNENLNDNPEVKPGNLLLAEPMLADPNFQRSVILVCEHDREQGSFGLVLNQLAEVIVSDPLLRPYLEGNLYVGGPVQQNTLHYIHSLPSITGSIPLGDGLLWGGDFQELQQALRSGEAQPGNCRFFIGYSGWAPQQLDGEISQNSWVIARTSPSIVLSTPADDLWKAVLTQMGGKYAMYTNFPTDPSLN